MISNHYQFIEAIREKRKVNLRFYSKADSGVLDLVCAPLDYGLQAESPSEIKRYSLWDYASSNGSHTLNLLPDQVLDIRLLGDHFDPAEFGMQPTPWSVTRNWGASPPPSEPPPQGPATPPLASPATPSPSVPPAKPQDELKRIGGPNRPTG
jgi:hypothetical protein